MNRFPRQYTYAIGAMIALAMTIAAFLYVRSQELEEFEGLSVQKDAPIGTQHPATEEKPTHASSHGPAIVRVPESQVVLGSGAGTQRELVTVAGARIPSFAQPDPLIAEKEMKGTERMVAAHAPLRTHAVSSPDSPENRRILETMVSKAMQRAENQTRP